MAEARSARGGRRRRRRRASGVSAMMRPTSASVELAVSLCGDLDREKLEVHLLKIVGQHGVHQGQPRPSLEVGHGAPAVAQNVRLHAEERLVVEGRSRLAVAQEK